MLPFLHPKKMASVIIAHRHIDGSSEKVQEEGEIKPEKIRVAEDLIRAIHSKDAESVLQALQKAIQSLDHDKKGDL